MLCWAVNNSLLCMQIMMQIESYLGFDGFPCVPTSLRATSLCQLGAGLAQPIRDGDGCLLCMLIKSPGLCGPGPRLVLFMPPCQRPIGSGL